MGDDKDADKTVVKADRVQTESKDTEKAKVLVDGKDSENHLDVRNSVADRVEKEAKVKKSHKAMGARNINADRVRKESIDTEKAKALVDGKDSDKHLDASNPTAVRVVQESRDLWKEKSKVKHENKSPDSDSKVNHLVADKVKMEPIADKKENADENSEKKSGEIRSEANTKEKDVDTPEADRVKLADQDADTGAAKRQF